MKRLLVLFCGVLLSGTVFAEAAFSLSGRISIRQQEAAYHGTLSWQHARDSDTLLLSGPLGQGAAELRRDLAGVTLQLPDGERHEAATLDELALRLFGAPLPLSALPGWMRGVAPQAQLDAAGRPQRLVLPDWTVEWLRYDEAGQPQLLSLESPTVGVRLRIDSLETPESCAAESLPTPIPDTPAP